jgi:hypothetical protein
MNGKHPDRTPLRLRDLADEPTPPPLLRHHPVVGISLVLIVTSFVQIAVWVVGQRLPPGPSTPVSPAIVHAGLLDTAVEGVCAVVRTGQGAQVSWFLFLALGWFSGPAWYLAVRAALGPGWALAAALGWVAHPSFAFLAQRATPLALLMVVIPLLWLALLRWRQRPGWPAALLVALAGGVLSTVSILGLLFLPVVVVSMMVPGWGRRVAIDLPLVLTVWILVTTAWWLGLHDRTEHSLLNQRVVLKIWDELEMAEPDGLAAAARAWQASYQAEHWLSPLSFLAYRCRTAPAETFRWLLGRAGRTSYSISGGGLQRPVLAAQLLWLVPASWGLIVGLRHPPWRFAAATAAALIVLVWVTAALVEPLARSVTPILGFGILFALIGLADIYERLFGRRLTQEADKPDPSALPARSRRSRIRLHDS